MSCYSPLKAYKIHGVKTESNKAVLVFNHRLTIGKTYSEVDLPCGQCIGCRIDKSRDWACRCYHEASMYDENCFVTFTYDDENLPENGSLTRGSQSDFTLFMKRLRKKVKKKIRYFQCGEYGDTTGRPHHHACLFGFDFEDKVLYSSGS